MEVMMAAIVMALAITTSITTMQRGFQALDSARCLTLAGQIMQSELEKTRLKDWTIVDAYAKDTNTALALETQFAANPITSHRSFSLSRRVTTEGTNMLRITYSVNWRTLDGRTLSRSYMSIYSRNGLYDFYYNTTTS